MIGAIRITIPPGHSGLLGQAKLHAHGADEASLPIHAWRQQLFPAVIQWQNQANLHPIDVDVHDVTMDREAVKNGIYFSRKFKYYDRHESDLVAADPLTGEVRKKTHSVYPNVIGVLTTAGGLVFTAYMDWAIAAYDDTTLDPVWKINVGSGLNAPPMTFEAGGKQYVAILSGVSRRSKGRLVLAPELRDIRNQTMLFVFGLKVA